MSVGTKAAAAANVLIPEPSSFTVVRVEVLTLLYLSSQVCTKLFLVLISALIHKDMVSYLQDV